jgi:deoxyadenosine/deoxycytidine kinase
MILISIEGNIGSGKSTFLEYLEGHLGTSCGKVAFVPEPVAMWNAIRDEEGRTILERYYDDQKSHAFAFQMMAYVSRLNLLKETLAHDYDVIVMERSLRTDRFVFAQMLRDEDMMTKMEFDIYTKWFESFLDEIPEPQVVYLRTSPTVALTRVGVRSRPGESIPLEYLEKCHQYHETWMWADEPPAFSQEPWLILNADRQANDQLFSEWTDAVRHRIQALQT